MYLYVFQKYCRFCSPACHFYPTPLLFGLKFRGSLWSRSVMLGSTESQVPKLISCEIIFAEFNQPTIQTDGQTDGLIMAIPRYATLRAVKTRMIRLPDSERILIRGLCSAIFTAQCTLVQSAVLRSYVVCLSVRL